MTLKKIILLIYFILFSLTSFAQFVRIETCSSTIYINTMGKKYFSIIVNNVVIYNIQQDSIALYFFLENKSKHRYYIHDKKEYYEKYKIDTNNFIILFKTHRIVVLNNKIYDKNEEITRINAESIIRIKYICIADAMKKYGWWRGRHGAIIIDTKERTNPDE